MRAYQAPSPLELERVTPEFPEVAPAPPLRGAMVQIDERFSNLGLSAKAGWTVPQEHPDVQPAHEALQLRELFAELSRTLEVGKRPADFRQRVRDAETDALTRVAGRG